MEEKEDILMKMMDYKMQNKNFMTDLASFCKKVVLVANQNRIS